DGPVGRRLRSLAGSREGGDENGDARRAGREIHDLDRGRRRSSRNAHDGVGLVSLERADRRALASSPDTQADGAVYPSRFIPSTFGPMTSRWQGLLAGLISAYPVL